MNRHLMLTGTLALAAALTAIPAFAGGGRGHRRGPGFGLKLLEKVDATAEQRAQIEALKDEMRQELAPVREAMQAKREEMRALWSAETPDRDAILAKHAEMDEVRSALRARRVEFRLAVQQILTPEQRARLAELRPERGHRGGRGFGKGPGHGGFGPPNGFGPPGDCPCMDQ